MSSFKSKMAGRLGAATSAFKAAHTKMSEAKYNMKDIITSVIGFTFAVSMIAVGAMLVSDEALIGTIASDKTNGMNYGLGVTFCLLGSLLVTFGLFKFVKSVL